MLQMERYERITNAINQNGFMGIDDIVSKLGISRSTVHRDLCELEKMHQILRIRGGAVSLNKSISHEPPLELRRDSQLEEKQRIAKAALQYVNERDTVLLDSGTTTIELARLFNGFESLMVATYDLFIANELSNMQNITLLVIGGVQRKRFNTLIGYFSEVVINQIHADTLFLSVDAIDIAHGCMNYNIEEISVKKSLMRSAKKVIVLCDHTKFETIAFINTCNINEVNTIITGKEARPETINQLREMGVDVILV